MAKNAFDKFINKGATGAKKKEAIRQEKRKIKLDLKKKGEEERKLNEDRYRLVTNRDARNKQQETSEEKFGKKNFEVNKPKKSDDQKTIII